MKGGWLLAGILGFQPLALANVSNGTVANRLQNFEVELEMLKNSISTQEQAREALEKEVSSLLKATRDSLAESRNSSSARQKSFDGTVDKLSQDLKLLKNHSNELSQTVNDLAKTVQGLKDSEHQQAQAIKELEQAMRALTMAMQGKPSGKSSGPSGTYTVKSGDSLEKIARAHGMTVSELKELNGIKNSTIRPGQELTVRQP